ncbi:MAG: hypothetical protein A2297_09980 [Elusimicrobia bacterium RIFOXYB2_FULL_48_7]|nr:MAG: hypothetical protein A2297_09980 [Elusimicrobia bacterium RIFOXYB2_FULL_48_7]
MDKKAIIYYFTGTGNALRMAHLAAAELEQAGFKVLLADIAANGRKVGAISRHPDDLPSGNRGQSSISPEHAEAELIGIVSPVYGFGLPQLMAKFLRKLPPSKSNQKCFVFISSAGNEGICVMQAAFHLKRKGYDLTFARTFKLVSNWIMFETLPDSETRKNIFDENEKLLQGYMKDIIDDPSIKSVKYYHSNPAMAALLGIVYYGFVFFGRHFLGKLFATNNKCNSCQYCHKHCPSKTVKWVEKRPYWGWNCQQCFRCINLCPNGAIETSTVAVIVFFISIFGGPFLFKKLVPDALLDYAGALKPVLENLFAMHLVFGIIGMWLVQILLSNRVTSGILPQWFTTRNKERYREPHFRP